MEAVWSLITGVLGLINKYGILTAITIVAVLGVFVLCACGVFNAPIAAGLALLCIIPKSVETIITNNDKQKEINHLKGLEKRSKMQPRLNAALEGLLEGSSADRAFIVELHNGSNNTAGLPFLHGSVTYDKTVAGLDSIDDEYQNISLSRFTMAQYLHRHATFSGSIDDIAKIDEKLAFKLKGDGVKHLTVMTIYSHYGELGWFGVIYNRENDIPDYKEISKHMMIASQTIAMLLGNTKK